ncbi:hypothetical protein GF314_15255, partial [bacterium]|nr:hypothetical protein [bacterium]
MRGWIWRLVGVLIGVVVAMALWRWSDAPDAARGLDGGPLFDFAADAVVRLEVRRALSDDELLRDGDGWRLEGTHADIVDTRRMTTVLETLVGGEGFPVLPGTEPGERRFGFASERALELVFHLRGGGRHRLALGDLAPVSDQIYASGAGRPGVFGVGGRYYAAAAELPDNVRLQTLLPEMRLSGLDSLVIGRRGGDPWTFLATGDGRWWLAHDAADPPLVGLAAAYQRRFADRRTTIDGRHAVLASQRRLADVVHWATASDVVAFVPATEATPALLADQGLAPPYRTVTLG